jgi:hypothetical protein
MNALRAPSVPLGLSEIATEFKRLEELRRSSGLSLGDAEVYRTLSARLSDALAAGQKLRRVDERQFLRVPFKMDLLIRRANDAFLVLCHNYGGGGCAIASDHELVIDQLLLLDGALLDGERFPLRLRATVAWTRRPTAEGEPTFYGLRFALDSRIERDQIDRLFYRVLDLFLSR